MIYELFDFYEFSEWKALNLQSGDTDHIYIFNLNRYAIKLNYWKKNFNFVLLYLDELLGIHNGETLLFPSILNIMACKEVSIKSRLFFCITCVNTHPKRNAPRTRKNPANSNRPIDFLVVKSGFWRKCIHLFTEL